MESNEYGRPFVFYHFIQFDVFPQFLLEKAFLNNICLTETNLKEFDFHP